MSAKTTVSWLSIFTSSSTLVCCALPALLVALGAGAALSGLVSVFPQIVWLSEHKLVVFVVAGAMLVIAALMQWRARRMACPPDAALAAACALTRDKTPWVLGLSVALYLVGGFFAFVAPFWLAAGADALHRGTGELQNLYPDELSVTIRHDPMPTLNMGAMTMPFSVQRIELLDGLKPNQRVEFEVRQDGSEFVIQWIKRVP
jgi:Cu/Ag efflux protein CusF